MFGCCFVSQCCLNRLHNILQEGFYQFCWPPSSQPMWMCMVFPAEYFWVSELHLDTLDSKTAVYFRDKYIHSLYTCTFSSDVSLSTSAWRPRCDGQQSGDEAVVNPTVRTVVSSLHLSTYCLLQTPSTCLRYPSFNHCHNWLRHRSRETVS